VGFIFFKWAFKKYPDGFFRVGIFYNPGRQARSNHLRLIQIFA